MFARAKVSALLGITLCALAVASERPVKIGIKTPGIQIPFTSVKPESEVTLPGPALGIAFGERVYFAYAGAGGLRPFDPKTSKLEDGQLARAQVCTGAVTGFGGIWVTDCAGGKLVKFDPKANKLKDGVAVSIARGPASLAASSDSIWVISDHKTALTRIDPEKEAVVAETRLPAGCTALSFGETALWAACPEERRVLRINALTNLVEQRIEVPDDPAALVVAEGSVWVLSEKSGKIFRIDPKTHKVTATIELMAPAKGGSIAAGEGAIWVSIPGFPLTRIDPASDKVLQQFTGAGNGLVFVGNGSVWLADAAGKVRRYDPKRIRATLPD